MERQSIPEGCWTTTHAQIVDLAATLASALRSGATDSAKDFYLTRIKGLVVDYVIKVRAVAEQSLLRAAEPTILRHNDSLRASSKGENWNINYAPNHVEGEGYDSKRGFEPWLRLR